MRLGYDNEKYIRTQSAHIRERISQFGGKLYLEFGGKLYDDNHAARVLPDERCSPLHFAIVPNILILFLPEKTLLFQAKFDTITEVFEKEERGGSYEIRLR